MNSFTVVSVNTSEKKGTPKSPVPLIRCLPNLGVEGDAHAGPGKRQVSFLAAEAVDALTATGVTIGYGDFAENITTRGIDLPKLPIGTRLILGPVELEVSQIGKTCHTRCEIFKRVGDCVMPQQGIFAKVITGGEIAPGTVGHYSL